MKKRTLSIVIAAAMLGTLLSGCGAQKSEPAFNDASSQPAVEAQDNTPPAESEPEDSVPSDSAETSEPDTGIAELLPELVPTPGGTGENLTVTLEQLSESRNDGDSYDSNYMGYTAYEKVHLGDEDAADYPNLVSALDGLNELFEIRNDQDWNDIESFFVPGQQYGENYLSCDYHCDISRADKSVLSVRENRNIDLGGPHPYYATLGYNYEVETGKQLAITDVVTDVDTFCSLVDKEVQEKYPEIYSNLSTNPVDYIHSFDLTNSDGLPYTLDSECITVYFNPYSIAPFAGGQQIIKLYYDENPGLINEKYTTPAKNYFIPLAEDEELDIDINGDGARETVSVYKEVVSEYEYKEMANVNGNSICVSEMTFGGSGYVVNTDGKYYLYVFADGYNDYTELAVIDLSTASFDMSKNIVGDVRVEYVSDYYGDAGSTYTGIIYTLTDPLEFMLSSHSDVFSTLAKYAVFKVGDDGYPVMEGDFYSLCTDVALSTKTDIYCEVVDAKGNVIENGTVPAGTIIGFVRTDGESWADFQEVDPSLLEPQGEDSWRKYVFSDNYEYDATKPLYRISCDTSSWPHTINGISEEEVFDGTTYAG